MCCALLIGSVTAIVSVVLIGGLLGLPVAILASLGPKSVTTPIAMSLAAANGGIPVLTAVFVILTGVFGAVIVTPLMNRDAHPRLRRARLRGRACRRTGSAPPARSRSTRSPAPFAGIALGLNGAVTAVVTPVIMPGLLHLFTR